MRTAQDPGYEAMMALEPKVGGSVLLFFPKWKNATLRPVCLFVCKFVRWWGGRGRFWDSLTLLLPCRDGMQNAQL